MAKEKDPIMIHKAGGIVMRTDDIPSIVLLYRAKQ